MQIDLSWLKLHPKESQNFHLEKEFGDSRIVPDIRILDTIAVDLEVTNTGRLMVGRGKIIATLGLECDRCLKSFQRQTEVPFTVEFCSEENRTYFKNEESFVYFDDELQVDIESIVLENIMLSLPLRVLCSSECKGLCTICGQDLNLAECHCQEKELDPRWELLKKMP